MVKGYGAPEVAASFARVKELYREVDEHPGQAEALSAIFAYHIARADYPAALETAQEMERLGALEMTWLSLGTHAYYTGQLEYCIACMQRCLEEYEAFSGPRPMRGLDAKVASLCWMGMAQLMLGRPDLSVRLMQEAVSFAHQLKLSHSVAFAILLRQSHDFWADDPQAVLDGMEEHLAICRQQAFTYFLTLSMVLAGWACFRLQPDARHAETIERGLQGWRRTGALLAASQHEAALVEVHTTLGHYDIAQNYLESSRTHLNSSGEMIYAPLLAHLEGELLLKQSPEDASRVEALFRESLGKARAMKARWHELRPVIGLVRLLRNQGRHDEARAELQAVLDGFTPEMDAPVLARARQLLE
jgi:adenylate cyclase